MKNKKLKYTAVIIGAGRIAAGFDTPKNKDILTHAHACIKHKEIELIGFVDMNKAVATAAAKRWGTEAFSSLKEIIKKYHLPDIVSICTPDATHKTILLDVLKYAPKLVIIEKPLTLSLSDTKLVIDSYEEKKVPLLVNFSRRFDATIQKLKHDIELGVYGKIISASGIYANGLAHNGQHIVDLSRYFFGEIISAKNLHILDDGALNGLSVSGFLTFLNCPQFYLIATDERKYGIFEIDIIAEKRRIRLQNFGFELLIQSVEEDKRYKGFFGLGEPKTYATNLPNAMYCLIDNAVKYLDKKESLICSGREALNTQEICEILCPN